MKLGTFVAFVAHFLIFTLQKQNNSKSPVTFQDLIESFDNQITKGNKFFSSHQYINEYIEANYKSVCNEDKNSKILKRIDPEEFVKAMELGNVLGYISTKYGINIDDYIGGDDKVGLEKIIAKGYKGYAIFDFNCRNHFMSSKVEENIKYTHKILKYFGDNFSDKVLNVTSVDNATADLTKANDAMNTFYNFVKQYESKLNTFYDKINKTGKSFGYKALSPDVIVGLALLNEEAIYYSVIKTEGIKPKNRQKMIESSKVESEKFKNDMRRLIKDEKEQINKISAQLSNTDDVVSDFFNNVNHVLDNYSKIIEGNFDFEVTSPSPKNGSQKFAQPKVPVFDGQVLSSYEKDAIERYHSQKDKDTVKESNGQNIDVTSFDKEVPVLDSDPYHSGLDLKTMYGVASDNGRNETVTARKL